MSNGHESSTVNTFLLINLNAINVAVAIVVLLLGGC